MNLEERVKKHMEICEHINNLYALKNRKYGNSFSKTYEEYGPAMLCILLEDKLQRAKQLLLKGEPGTDDESIIDTLQDLANYSIMGIMEIDKAYEKKEELGERTV